MSKIKDELTPRGPSDQKLKNNFDPENLKQLYDSFLKKFKLTEKSAERSKKDEGRNNSFDYFERTSFPDKKDNGLVKKMELLQHSTGATLTITLKSNEEIITLKSTNEVKIVFSKVEHIGLGHKFQETWTGNVRVNLSYFGESGTFDREKFLKERKDLLDLVNNILIDLQDLA
jgi:hypothetical protein